MFVHVPPGHLAIPKMSQICPSRSPPAHVDAAQTASPGKPHPCCGGPACTRRPHSAQGGMSSWFVPEAPSTAQVYSSPLKQRKRGGSSSSQSAELVHALPSFGPPEQFPAKLVVTRLPAPSRTPWSRQRISNSP